MRMNNKLIRNDEKNENKRVAKVMREARHEINCRTETECSQVQFIRSFVY